MKKISIILILSFIVFFLGYILNTDSIPPFNPSEDLIANEIEVKLKKFNFVDLDKKEHSITDFKGKIVILNFWASWCAPCITEFPEILKIVKKYQKDVILVAISNDNSKKDILKFLSKFQKETGFLSTNIIIGVDASREISSSFNVLKLPETFILNRRGNIIKKVVGASEWGKEQLDTFFKNQLGQ